MTVPEGLRARLPALGAAACFLFGDPRNEDHPACIGGVGYAAASPAMPRVPDPAPVDVRCDPRADLPAAETELVLALQRGEDAAFARLVRDYASPLLATARRMLGNEEDAADALQETFLSAFRAIQSFEGKSRLTTWLHRITVNAVLMKMRSKKRCCERPIDDLVPSFTADGHHVEPPCPWSEHAMRMLQTRESSALVRRAIDDLPPAYREVIVLRDIEGLSTDEAGQHLGVTANAIKIRLHRARQALRTLLGDCLEDLTP